jgi:hypothetical protein
MKPRCRSPLSRILGMVQVPWNFSPFLVSRPIAYIQPKPHISIRYIAGCSVFFQGKDGPEALEGLQNRDHY